MPNTDPWLDESIRLGSENEYFTELTQTAVDLGMAPDNPLEPIADPLPVPEPVIPLEPVDTPGPKVIQIEGGKVTLEKTSKGWTGTLDPGTGANPEVFYGATKDDLLANVLKGKLHATKTIQELNRKVKLGDSTPPRSNTPAPSSQYKATVRELNAEERFEFKTLWDSDPVKAQDYYNEKRFGLSPEAFAAKLNEGEAAKEINRQADIDRIAVEFVRSNPDYYPDDASKNYIALLRYMSKDQFGRAPTPTEISSGAAVRSLYDAGVWTVQDLEAAKDDLLESGLLLRKPVAPTQEPPVAVPPQPVTPPAPVVPAAIPAPTVRTRAGNLGLRVSDASTVPTPPSTPSSDDDFYNKSDEEIDRTMQALRQSRLRGR